MRHKRYVKKLGVKTPHRKAMMTNMADSLLAHGKIKTTTARAKVVQSKVERLITLAKRGGLHARRQAVAALANGATVKKLFDEIAPEFKNVNGGYTRRAFFGRRLGDGASLTVVELNIQKKVVAEPKKGKEGAEAEVKEEPKKAKAAAKEPKAKKEKSAEAKKPKAKKANDKKAPAKA